MKNEPKKINRFSGLTDRAVSDEELEKVSGGGYGDKFVPKRLCPCGQEMTYDGEKYICTCGHIEY